MMVRACVALLIKAPPLLAPEMRPQAHLAASKVRLAQILAVLECVAMLLAVLACRAAVALLLHLWAQR